MMKDTLLNKSRDSGNLTHRFVVDEGVSHDGGEEVVVGDAEVLKVGRLLDCPDQSYSSCKYAWL